MNNPISKEESKRRANLHHRGRRKIKKLLRKQKNRCYWCGCYLVSSDFPILVGKCNGRLRNKKWLDVKYYRLVTVDHLKRVSDGGLNNIENLVAACWYCNLARDENHTDTYPHLMRTICECGNFKKRREKNCLSCRVKADLERDAEKHQYLLDMGWEFWPEPSFLDPLFGRYQCPVTKKLRQLDYAFRCQKCNEKGWWMNERNSEI